MSKAGPFTLNLFTSNFFAYVACILRDSAFLLLPKGDCPLALEAGLQNSAGHLQHRHRSGRREFQRADRGWEKRRRTSS